MCYDKEGRRYAESGDGQEHAPREASAISDGLSVFAAELYLLPGICIRSDPHGPGHILHGLQRVQQVQLCGPEQLRLHVQGRILQDLPEEQYPLYAGHRARDGHSGADPRGGAEFQHQGQELPAHALFLPEHQLHGGGGHRLGHALQPLQGPDQRRAGGVGRRQHAEVAGLLLNGTPVGHDRGRVEAAGLLHGHPAVRHAVHSQIAV